VHEQLVHISPRLRILEMAKELALSEPHPTAFGAGMPWLVVAAALAYLCQLEAAARTMDV